MIKLPKDRAFKYFILYLINISFFGLIYFSLYTHNPNNFSFNNDIVQGRIQLDSAANFKSANALFHQNKKREKAITVLVELIQSKDTIELVNNYEVEDNNDFEITSFSCHIGGTKVMITETTARRGSNNLHAGYKYFPTRILKLSMHNDKENFWYESNTNVQFILSKSNEFSDTNFHDIAVKFKDRINAYLIIDEHKIATLESFDLLEPSWNVVDFAYFSLVSLPVGTYGDILPNSSLIRLLIIIQTLINLYILIYLINRTGKQ